MPAWHDVETADPELAGRIRTRFEDPGLAIMATLRADGSPRISAVECFFVDGQLELGMMPGSRKAADLLRDPRVALHAATTDKQVSRGDAKIAGRAVPVTDDEARERFVAEVRRVNGEAPPAGPFPLFAVDVREASMLGVPGDHLAIDVWTPDRGTRRLTVR